jgi:hypothetical protein
MHFCEKSLLKKQHFRCTCHLLRMHISIFPCILRLEVSGQVVTLAMLSLHTAFPDTSIKTYFDVHSCWNTLHSLSTFLFFGIFKTYFCAISS